MYDFALQECDADLAKLIYNASSDRMRLTYGIFGVLLVHWFFSENVALIKKLLDQSKCKSPDFSGDK